MRQRKKLNILAIYAFIILYTGCKVQGPPANGGSSNSNRQQGAPYYVATKESVPNINRYKARLLFEDALTKCEGHFHYYKKWANAQWDSELRSISPPKISETGAYFEMQPTNTYLPENQKHIRKYNIDFATIQIPVLEYGPRKGAQITFQIPVPKWEGFYLLGANYDESKQLLDALFILKNLDQKAEDQKELESFKPIALQYRSLTTKPPLNEEARKYLVQATNATEEKRYMDGIDLLEKALTVDPAYPLAHFNRALLWAQVSMYGAAVLEMKKYLMLVPDAKDARASQDKIYEWEGKLTK
jgi:hypothetical protein